MIEDGNQLSRDQPPLCLGPAGGLLEYLVPIYAIPKDRIQVSPDQCEHRLNVLAHLHQTCIEPIRPDRTQLLDVVDQLAELAVSGRNGVNRSTDNQG